MICATISRSRSVIYAIGMQAMAPEPPAFTDAMIRIRTQQGLYVLEEGAVGLDESTLFSTRIALPSNLTEGQLQGAHFPDPRGQGLRT